MGQSRSAGLLALSTHLHHHPWTHTAQPVLLGLLDDLVLAALLLLDSSLAPAVQSTLLASWNLYHVVPPQA
ncbi:hypothetical protein IRJ41_003532 [Triplophysa rosa]|uniref:Uncharacterized protein n=1 Tax=Triplophysa rosa TaxID=992332 RepID=A0A9W7TTK8_TRIRA|nr:hypothetical protein IRJ41_003532 [Triplophysa rosa]